MKYIDDSVTTCTKRKYLLGFDSGKTSLAIVLKSYKEKNFFSLESSFPCLDNFRELCITYSSLVKDLSNMVTCENGHHILPRIKYLENVCRSQKNINND